MEGVTALLRSASLEDPPSDSPFRAPRTPAASAKKGKSRFYDPYGEGDICAAGLLPFFEREGESHLLLQVENKNDKRVVAAFGGKVEQSDAHWCDTVAREFLEETGGLLPEEALQAVRACRSTGTDEDTTYVAAAKFQMLFYPIPEGHVVLFEELIAAYHHKFQGKVVPGRRGERFIVSPLRQMLKAGYASV